MTGRGEKLSIQEIKNIVTTVNRFLVQFDCTISFTPYVIANKGNVILACKTQYGSLLRKRIKRPRRLFPSSLSNSEQRASRSTLEVYKQLITFYAFWGLFILQISERTHMADIAPRLAFSCIFSGLVPPAAEPSTLNLPHCRQR